MITLTESDYTAVMQGLRSDEAPTRKHAVRIMKVAMMRAVQRELLRQACDSQYMASALEVYDTINEEIADETDDKH